MKITDEVPESSFAGNLSKSSNMSWCNSSFKRHRKAKDKSWAIFNETPTPENLSIALEKQRVIDKVSYNAKIKYEQKICKSLKCNPKPFYSYLRNRRDMKTCVTNLNNGSGGKISSAKETANVLAEAFNSVFVREPYGPLNNFSVNNERSSCISDIVISDADVLRELKGLDISKSVGPDNIHPKLLKTLSLDSRFVNALTELYQRCALSCSIPLVWKEANVTVLFKNGSKSDPLNYSPISLTCIILLCAKFMKNFIGGTFLIFLKIL